VLFAASITDARTLIVILARGAILVFATFLDDLLDCRAEQVATAREAQSERDNGDEHQRERAASPKGKRKSRGWSTGRHGEPSVTVRTEGGQGVFGAFMARFSRADNLRPRRDRPMRARDFSWFRDQFVASPRALVAPR
jgi:hypothetical protein